MKAVVYLGCPANERSDAEGGLAAAGLAVSWADTVADVLLRLQKVDAPALVDLSRGAAAIHSIRELRTSRPGTVTLAVTDLTRPDLTTEAILAGTADVFLRPLDGRRVARAIEREQAYAASLESGRRPEAVPAGDLYGQSPSMRVVLAQVKRAALERGGVLVAGEFGSGREMVARTLHLAQGSRGTFVTLDCANYNADSLERAIFGNRAATSKDAGRHPERVHHSGALYRANGGTLYFHNVAELPTRVQARLVRALRDQEVQMTDTGDEVVLDVRLVAAGDGDIDSAVQDGRLRDDLVRRLSGVRIDLPPLRQRREDIGPLANFFVRQICAMLRVPPKTLSRPALSLIVALPWRRNAVELRAMLEAVVGGHAGGRGISLDDVLNHVSLGGGMTIAVTDRTLRDARSQFEREYITAVLERHRGRISDAARTLGLQRTNLYRKIRTLNVDRSRRR
jgi:DNA-binding NtrC family response regulator